MKKIIFAVLVFIVSCKDAKKEKLDSLYSERNELLRKQDSIKDILYPRGGDPKKIDFSDTTTEVYDTATEYKKIRLAVQIDNFTRLIKKVDFSIDSLSKY